MLRQYTIPAALLLTGLFAGGIASPGAPPSQDKKQDARVDAYGDPLPEHAVLRIGTVRLRPGGHVYTLAFAEEGKKLVTVSALSGVQLWDVPTGKEVFRFGEQHATYICAISPDGSRVALYEKAQGCRIYETSTGKEVKWLPGPKLELQALAFSPDNRLIAAVGADLTIPKKPKESSFPRFTWVWNIATGERVFASYINSQGSTVSSLAFSPDGRSLAYSGSYTSSFVWDIASGEVLLEIAKVKQATDGYKFLTLSADGKSITGVGINVWNGHVFRWEIATGKQELLAKKPEGNSLITLAPDGKSFILSSADAIGLLDAETGQLRLTLEGKNYWLGNGKTAFSLDQKYVAAVDNEVAIHIWDLKTGKRLYSTSEELARPVTVRFTTDGSAMVATSPGKLRFLDPHTGKIQREIPREFRSALSPDGQVFAIHKAGKSKVLQKPTRVVEEDGLMRIMRANNGELIKEFAIPWPVGSLQFSVDDRYLASATGTGIQGAVSLPTAKTRKVLQVWDTTEAKRIIYIDKETSGLTGMMGSAFTDDGRYFASYEEMSTPSKIFGELTLWNLATGAKSMPGPASMPRSEIGRFSPSGRLMAWSPRRGDGIEIRELASGKLVRRLDAIKKFEHSNLSEFLRFLVNFPLTFSADGRTLASATFDGEIVLWDVFSGETLTRLADHRGPIESIGFSPDGKRLVSSGSDDASILVWDVSPWTQRGGQGKPLTDKELADAWNDLAKQDNDDSAARVYTFIARSLHSPKETVAFLSKHLLPAPPAHKEHIDKLIAALASKTFAEREKATADLQELGPQVLSELQAALGRNPLPEARQRIEQLLTKIENRFSPELLQAHRALEVLEMLDTPEAVKLLESLAQGSPDAWLTQEAAWSLKRVRKRLAK